MMAVAVSVEVVENMCCSWLHSQLPKDWSSRPFSDCYGHKVNTTVHELPSSMLVESTTVFKSVHVASPSSRLEKVSITCFLIRWAFFSTNAEHFQTTMFTILNTPPLVLHVSFRSHNLAPQVPWYRQSLCSDPLSKPKLRIQSTTNCPSWICQWW
jgi:hypothetical protein